MPHCSNALAAEINGIVAGMKLAESLSADQVLILSDSAEAIWAVQCGIGIPDECVQIAMQGMELFARYPLWRLQHISREFNGLADLLAKKARSRGWSWSRTDAIPWLPSLMPIGFQSRG